MEAITGRRILQFGELRRMMLAENIAVAFRARADPSNNWAVWARKNPVMEKILIEAELLCQA